MISAVVAAALCVLAITLIVRMRHARVTLAGVVLRQDSDPRKQLPIQDVKITATEGERSVEAQTDASGLFRLNLPNGSWREQPVTLAFVHPDYRPMEIAPRLNGELYVVRMTPIPVAAVSRGQCTKLRSRMYASAMRKQLRAPWT